MESRKTSLTTSVATAVGEKRLTDVGRLLEVAATLAVVAVKLGALRLGILEALEEDAEVALTALTEAAAMKVRRRQAQTKRFMMTSGYTSFALANSPTDPLTRSRIRCSSRRARPVRAE